MSDPRLTLAESLAQRTPSWTVARAILGLGLHLRPEARRELEHLADNPSWEEQTPSDFDRVTANEAQIDSFLTLFPASRGNIAGVPVRADDPAALRRLIELGMTELGFAADQHPGLQLAMLKKNKPDSGRKALRKCLRLLARIEKRAEALERAWQLRSAQMQAKSRLAREINPDRLDDVSLAFVAYLAARANRRSRFQLGSQSKAQDTVSVALEKMLPKDAAWDQIALVKPTVNVLSRCSPEDQGRLVGRFHLEMSRSAARLGELWPTLPERMRAEMVMVRGTDSSSWNAYAGAFNTMRSAWISAMISCGLGDNLETYLPGKAPRLIASDLAWMNRNAGGDLHEDTRIFTRLALPWLVTTAEATQGRGDIVNACQAEGVSATASGWVSPRAAHILEVPEPEPALVHGVAISDPNLALQLKRAGVFSGKGIREDLLTPEALIAAQIHRVN